MPARNPNRICSVEDCGAEVHAKGFCSTHYCLNKRHGEPVRVRQVGYGTTCKWNGCDKPTRALGYCSGHYKMARREGVILQGKYERDHPLYSLWWARKKAGILSIEWADDFQKFVDDVGERPGKFYSLVTLREGPFGPGNFKWHPHLKQQIGESKSQFWARKWQAQKEARPGWDNQRALKRKYGITYAEYDEMFAGQNGKCAICLGDEKKIDHKTNMVRRLAVDHCHDTEKVRGLLCSRCNMMIGQIEENVGVLEAMVAYINYHKG